MADSPSELPLTEIQVHVQKCCEQLKGHPRQCARSAFRHLRKAWALHAVDQEMSLFRAITAEEEAATALMLALKERRYPGADQLNHRNHDHKAGVGPFLDAVRKVLVVGDFAKLSVQISEGDPPRLDVSFSAHALGLSPDPEARMWSEEPFHFTARMGKGDDDGEVMDFQEQVKELATSKGVEELLDHIRQEANVRNLILYAQSGGVPVVNLPTEVLLAKVARVCALLQLTIGIQQTKLHQLFAVQCLSAYLAVLKRFPTEPFDYEAAERPSGDETRFIVSKMGDDEPTVEAEIKREVSFDKIVVTDSAVDIHMTGLNDGSDYRLRFEEQGDGKAPA